MDFNVTNKYTVHFKDGTNVKSTGSSDRYIKSNISEELKWLEFHIEKEVAKANKEITDVLKVEITLEYVDK